MEIALDQLLAALTVDHKIGDLLLELCLARCYFRNGLLIFKEVHDVHFFNVVALSSRR